MSLNILFSYAFSAWFIRLGWMPHGGWRWQIHWQPVWRLALWSSLCAVVWAAWKVNLFLKER